MGKDPRCWAAGQMKVFGLFAAFLVEHLRLPSCRNKGLKNFRVGLH
jgi:hypothetical protein